MVVPIASYSVHPAKADAAEILTNSLVTKVLSTFACAFALGGYRFHEIISRYLGNIGVEEICLFFCAWRVFGG